MALIIIILIMLIGMGVVGSLYSSISPFVAKLGNISQYNIAYYGATMSAERGLSVLRYHDAGFEGTSSLSTGNSSDNVRGTFLLGGPAMGRFATDSTAQAGWVITSRTTSIPGSGDGNVETIYVGTGSSNYNALGYGEGINIPLYFDSTTNPTLYYTTPLSTDMDALIAAASPGQHLQGRIRIPEKIYTALGSAKLSDDILIDADADIDNDTIGDDVILTRGFQGYDVTDGENFSINPSIKQNFAYIGPGLPPAPYYEYDNGLRESVINYANTNSFDNINTTDTLAINGGFYFAINPDKVASVLLTGHNILPLSSSFTTTTFTQLLQEPISNVTGLTLSMAIVNRMQNTAGDFIPFLEYNLRLCNDVGCTSVLPLPSPYFSLEGSARIGDYRASITITKPVKQSTSASTFVTIF